MMRPRGLLVLFVLFSSISLYTKFIFDSQLKAWLEKHLTQLNGAQVNIGSIKTYFLQGKLVLKDIQFGSPTTPMRNTFQINTVTTQFAVGPIFRKKFHISDLNIDGFQYWTQRLEPSIDPESFDTNIMAAAVMDRASHGIYTGIRNELTDNPLRHLGQLGTGFTLQSRIALLADKLTTIRQLKSILNDLKEKDSYWERKTAEIPSEAAFAGLQNRIQKEKSKSDSTSLTELQSKLEELQNSIQELDQQIVTAKADLKKVDETVEQDVSFIRRELGLPDSNHEDLTDLIFGPVWLGFLEKLSYWIDFGRTQSPVGSSNENYGMTILTRKGKRAVHFGSLGALPSFLLEQATFKSGDNPQSNTVIIEGVLHGLNSDPVIYGKPTLLHLTADYPEKGFRNLTIDAMMDHTGTVPKENLTVSINSFPIQDWALSRTSDIQLKIKNALVGLDLIGEFEGEEVNLKWDMRISEAEYQIQSRFRPVEQTLKTIVQDMYSFPLEGTITGNKASVSFQSKSGLGRRLATGLRTEFKHEFSALNEAIVNETLSFFPPIKEQIETLIRKNREEVKPALEKGLNRLKSIEKSVAPLS